VGGDVRDLGPVGDERGDAAQWVRRQAEVDTGETTGVPSETARKLRELRRKNRELEQTIEILKAATTFFARECDPLHR
jgi:transposase